MIAEGTFFSILHAPGVLALIAQNICIWLNRGKIDSARVHIWICVTDSLERATRQRPHSNVTVTNTNVFVISGVVSWLY